MLIKTDSLGVPRFTNKDLINMIYQGHVSKCHVVLCEPSDDVNKFNNAMIEQGFDKLTTYIPIDTDKKAFDQALQSEWFMPAEYNVFPVYQYCIDNCVNNTQKSRIDEEFSEFRSRKMIKLLQYMKYLVDFMRANNIVWGVGRGSSVASYLLYVLGVHRIDSIQYDLDWREFLR